MRIEEYPVVLSGNVIRAARAALPHPVGAVEDDYEMSATRGKSTRTYTDFETYLDVLGEGVDIAVYGVTTKMPNQFEALGGLRIDLYDKKSRVSVYGGDTECAAVFNAISEQLPAVSQSQGPTMPDAVPPQKVFIVHGHDALRWEVKSFVVDHVDRAVDVVILADQANRGQTVIEKFENNATEAAFAIVLFTADDEGRANGTSDLRHRARQNVVLELGYFLGALGRNNVAVLAEEGIELPSDIAGLVYTSTNEWRYELGRELDAAGIAKK